MKADHHTLPRSTWALLAMLTLGWGFNWPMMKLAVNEMPVLSFRALCLTVGAAGLFTIARVGGHRDYAQTRPVAAAGRQRAAQCHGVECADRLRCAAPAGRPLC